MKDYLFYLDDWEIQEPIGFREIELSIKRDDRLHGITFEASTTTLGFYGAAADYLLEKKEEEGISAAVTFKVLANCDGYDYEEILSGRLNFGKFKRSCGSRCVVSMPWEEDSCLVVLRSRWELKVDLDKVTAVDGFTALQDYTGLAVPTDLPAFQTLAAVEGYVANGGDVIDLDIFTNVTENFVVRPTFGRPIYESINESQLSPTVFAASDNGFNDSVISPILLFSDSVDCFSGNFSYEIRLKGSYNIDYSIGSIGDIQSVKLIVVRGEYPDNLTVLHSEDLAFSGQVAQGTFDESWSGTLSLEEGRGFYAYFQVEGPAVPSLVAASSVTFDEETYVKIEGVKSCPPTQAELYLIHETLSRLTESVTNGCVRVKSQYYGRTDSEPFSFSQDGCGALRTLTSGLKIRNAEEAKFYASLKDVIEGLNGIDNIGIGPEPDPMFSQALLLRVEDVEYFYQDNEILRHDYVPEADEVTEESKHYAKVQAGFKKWEVESINGLDEFNSTREYSTSIDTLSNTLDITSNLVAGSYPIEVTRQQSFAETGGADTKFDNDIFVIEMERDQAAYAGVKVKQGGITSPSGIFSPSTVYNFGLSPVRNLMRWYKTIAAGFAAIGDSINQLFFQSGTGNTTAAGMLTDATCSMEGMVVAENQNIFTTQFKDTDGFTPLWKPELLTYEYPMSLNDYNTIKAAPYGYISVQCGRGEYLKY